MPGSSPQFECGPLRYSDWRGPWKSTPDDPALTHEEWSRAWSALKDWLGARYRVRFHPDHERQVFVDDLFDEEERTLVIAIRDHSILTAEFLGYLQEWLRSDWKSWRLAIPTDTGDTDMIMIYPESIKINAEAEKDINLFLLLMQQKMPDAQREARRQLGLE